jgi:hypothetical protein
MTSPSPIRALGTTRSTSKDLREISSAASCRGLASCDRRLPGDLSCSRRQRALREWSRTSRPAARLLRSASPTGAGVRSRFNRRLSAREEEPGIHAPRLALSCLRELPGARRADPGALHPCSAASRTGRRAHRRSSEPGRPPRRDPHPLRRLPAISGRQVLLRARWVSNAFGTPRRKIRKSPRATWPIAPHAKMATTIAGNWANSTMSSGRAGWPRRRITPLILAATPLCVPDGAVECAARLFWLGALWFDGRRAVGPARTPRTGE